MTPITLPGLHFRQTPPVPSPLPVSCVPVGRWQPPAWHSYVFLLRASVMIRRALSATLSGDSEETVAGTESTAITPTVDPPGERA